MSEIAASVFGMSVRAAMAVLALALTVGSGGCGRRGPPLPPLQVDPEAPRLYPLRQEGGQVVIRWHAPRLASDESVQELRLRKAIVSYRLVDILQLAAAERASRRAGSEDTEEETAEPLPEGERSDEAPDPEPPGEEGPGEGPSDPGPPAEAAVEESAPPAPEPQAEQEAQDEPDLGEPPEGEPPTEASDESSDPSPDPEPTGTLLDYEDLEFEILSEVESEIRGEERTLELPVEPDWVGRRLEVRVRYEARGGSSEESELQSLDITGPLPVLDGVSLEVGPQALTVRWRDSRSEVQEASALADPIFEVFRRRGDQRDRIGRAVGPTWADPELIWGEEVCYSARLVLAGGDDERVLPDPGPESAPPEPGPASWTPIPIRVPGAGSTALSVGPTSAEACVIPVDTFPPVPPSDLRLFWQAERTQLSWRESASADVTGYHVYRSGPDGTGFERLTRDPVEETVFGDAARDPRGSYRYAVTALDGADPPNESLPSESARAIPR